MTRFEKRVRLAFRRVDVALRESGGRVVAKGWGIRYGLAVVLGFAFLAAFSSGAAAKCSNDPGDTGIADSSCDCNTWKSLESRGWLEAQREITQNQNLIAKPDSTLEYSCLDTFANVAAGPGADSFSDTLVFGPVAGRSPISTDIALTNVVGSSNLAYGMQYSHSFLGGRSSVDNNLDGVVTGGAYNCQAMAQAWEAARCANFMSHAQDGFFSFEDHASDEKRKLPTPCNPDSRWNAQIQNALTNPPWQAQFAGPAGTTYSGIVTNLTPGSCGSPIPTGITINTLQRGTYPDAFCTNPGCHYNGSGCVSN